ncbi:MAG: hypothetical protein QM650_05860 [Microlunatus sp.]
MTRAALRSRVIRPTINPAKTAAIRAPAMEISRPYQYAGPASTLTAAFSSG